MSNIETRSIEPKTEAETSLDVEAIEERLARIGDWLSQGRLRSDLIQVAMNTWHVSRRTAQVYVQRVVERMQQDAVEEHRLFDLRLGQLRCDRLLEDVWARLNAPDLKPADAARLIGIATRLLDMRNRISGDLYEFLGQKNPSPAARREGVRKFIAESNAFFKGHKTFGPGKNPFPLPKEDAAPAAPGGGMSRRTPPTPPLHPCYDSDGNPISPITGKPLDPVIVAKVKEKVARGYSAQEAVRMVLDARDQSAKKRAKSSPAKSASKKTNPQQPIGSSSSAPARPVSEIAAPQESKLERVFSRPAGGGPERLPMTDALDQQIDASLAPATVPTFVAASPNSIADKEKEKTTRHK